MAKPVRWSGVGEAGFVSGMRLLFWLYRHSYTLLRIVMVPVVFYYFMTNSNARRSSRDYLRRLQASDKLGAAPSPSSWNVYRHLSSFARASLDKLGIWADPQRFGHIEFVNRQLLLEQMDSGQGAILMGAHLGNMEICRQMSQKTKRLKLNVLVHTRHAGMFNRLLRELDIHHELELIEVSELTPATAIRLSE